MGATRKRSATITLVLAGSTALSGCFEPEAQRDVYTKLDDCTKDWGKPQQCESVRDGRHSSSYFYGPSYYGSSFPSGKPRPSPNALEATHVTGGASQIVRSGSTSSLRTSSGGTAPGGSGTVSRSGFGSSGHASSGG